MRDTSSYLLSEMGSVYVCSRIALIIRWKKNQPVKEVRQLTQVCEAQSAEQNAAPRVVGGCLKPILLPSLYSIYEKKDLMVKGC